MKRSSIAVCALLLAGAAAANQHTEALPQAAHFKKAAGTWDATVEGEGPASKGVETVRLIGDGMWAISDFEATMSQGPFTGHGVSGYDPVKKKYVGVWVDTMSPIPFHMEGEMDTAGKVMTSKGMMPDPSDPTKTLEATMVETWLDADTRTFSMRVAGPDGKAMEMMKITYKRRK